ncbi:MAG: 4Fe-4S binding protein [Christensenella sp.]|nr:4Fe-4S binding protein [Christensenella sp.]
MAKLTFETDYCKGCGLCVGACPRRILQIDIHFINRKGHAPVRLMDETRCNGCGLCALMCPDCVITVER